MEILIADPAKNITAFVLAPVKDQEERSALARAILAEKSLKAEQVGFVIPPAGPASGSKEGLWRLEMAGGEFCGNAARSFGLYAAAQMGLKGKAKLFVSVSGADGPVAVEADVQASACKQAGWAAAEMPKPLTPETETIYYEGRPLPLLAFQGITQVIAPDLEPKHEVFYLIKQLVEEKLRPLPAAIGIMFYDTASGFLRPAVYVRSVDTLVFESSCGSGSAALGVWLSRDVRDGETNYAIAQPGGVIETKVTRKAGAVVRITIGGAVRLYTTDFSCDRMGM